MLFYYIYSTFLEKFQYMHFWAIFFLIFYRSNIDGKNDIDITEFKVRY